MSLAHSLLRPDPEMAFRAYDETGLQVKAMKRPCPGRIPPWTIASSRIYNKFPTQPQGETSAAAAAAAVGPVSCGGTGPGRRGSGWS